MIPTQADIEILQNTLFKRLCKSIGGIAAKSLACQVYHEGFGS